MERTSNFKNRFFNKDKPSGYKSSNYKSNNYKSNNYKSNQNPPNQNSNFSGNQNQNQNPNLSKIEQQASDIVSLNIQAINKDETEIKKDSSLTKQDFLISYKDKTYTYVIPEQILKKEKYTLPFWLQPIQVRLIPNDSSTFDFCNEVFIKLSETGTRVEIDNKQDNVLKKIKNAEYDKIPYIIVIGPKEKSIHKFIVRTLDGNQKLMSVGAFSHTLEELLLNKPKCKLN